MTTNKTIPTHQDVDEFLAGLSAQRQAEAREIIILMQAISNQPPQVWGPSIIGFGTQYYRYDSGHEGDMPVLAFSPRKTALTIYFEGFDDYSDLLENLGPHTTSKACLYIKNLAAIDREVLQKMLQRSYDRTTNSAQKPTTVDAYIAQIPPQARPKFDELRALVRATIPQATEVVSYGIIGYKVDKKRPRVFISGWNDHLAMYPVPSNSELQSQLADYKKGKGTLWFSLHEPLPKSVIKDVVRVLVKDRTDVTT